MAKPTYWEQLKHPKWQEMRLRVLERDGFTCRWCFEKEITLHVHHTFYEKGLSPWEYPTDSLVTLCESCHEEASDLQKETARLMGAVVTTRTATRRLNGYLHSLGAAIARKSEPAATYMEANGTAEMAGIGDYFGLTADEVLALAEFDDSDPDRVGLYGLDFDKLKAAGEKKRGGQDATDQNDQA
jgi:hypothetical protein